MTYGLTPQTKAGQRALTLVSSLGAEPVGGWTRTIADIEWDGFSHVAFPVLVP